LQTPSTPAIRDAFCRAVAGGLELRATGPEVYCGTLADGRQDLAGVASGRRGLVPHRLKSRIDGSSRTVLLPAGARVTAAPGTELDAGAPWARVFDDPPRNARLGGSFARRWAVLLDVCGGAALLAHLRHVWLESQAVRLACEPGRVLLSTELIARAASELAPDGLWWDTAAALPYYDWQLEAAVFPPVAIRRWDRLRLAMPGEVALDASIVDPRFSTSTPSAPRAGSKMLLGRRDYPSSGPCRRPTGRPAYSCARPMAGGARLAG
jgi:hypothetical protein